MSYALLLHLHTHVNMYVYINVYVHVHACNFTRLSTLLNICTNNSAKLINSKPDYPSHFRPAFIRLGQSFVYVKWLHSQTLVYEYFNVKHMFSLYDKLAYTHMDTHMHTYVCILQANKRTEKCLLNFVGKQTNTTHTYVCIYVYMHVHNVNKNIFFC